MLFSLRSFASPSLLWALPRTDGKISPRPPVCLCASSKTDTAAPLRGTRWGRPVLVRSAGIDHTSWPMLISSQVAFLTSPERAAVKTRKDT